MYINTLSDGSLQMTADGKERAFIRYLQLMGKGELNVYAQESAFIVQFMRPKYMQTAACSVGALTDAPLITDGTSVWGFMGYQVESFLDRLRDGKDVIWQKG